MEKLVFATNNLNKIEEVRNVLGDIFHIITLQEAGIDIEIPEPHNTLQANATEKSTTIYYLTKKNCFSEDSGLEVNALYGEPGVRSARYAGKASSAEDNIKKLLLNMEGEKDRASRFRTVISLILDGSEHRFEGTCEGKITEEQRGRKGFGYDPVFIPDGSDKTFAEMEMDEKNKFSHRKKAMKKMIAFLKINRADIIS